MDSGDDLLDSFDDVGISDAERREDQRARLMLTLPAAIDAIHGMQVTQTTTDWLGLERRYCKHA